MKKLLLLLALACCLALPAAAKADRLLDPVSKTIYYHYLTDVLGFDPLLSYQGVQQSDTVGGLESYIHQMTGEEVTLPDL